MTKVVVILGFLVAFGAGLVAGLNVRRHGLPPLADGRDFGHRAGSRDRGPGDRGSGSGDRGPGGFLAAHLKLDDEQRRQMDRIWSESFGKGPWEHDKKRRQAREERDEAIAALVRPGDFERYDQILAAYSEKLAALDREAKASFDKAVERTKQILNPEQRQKYEEFLKRHEGDRRGRGGPDRDRDRREKDRVTGDKVHGDKEHGRRPESRASTTRAAQPR